MPSAVTTWSQDSHLCKKFHYRWIDPLLPFALAISPYKTAGDGGNLRHPLPRCLLPVVGRAASMPRRSYAQVTDEHLC